MRNLKKPGHWHMYIDTGILQLFIKWETVTFRLRYVWIQGMIKLVGVCSVDGTAKTSISHSFVSFREPKTYLNLHVFV